MEGKKFALFSADLQMDVSSTGQLWQEESRPSTFSQLHQLILQIKSKLHRYIW